MAGKAVIVFGATGSVGSALVDLLSDPDRAKSFGFGRGEPLVVVAAAPDAVKALGSKYGSSGGGAAATNTPPRVLLVDCDGHDFAHVEAAFDQARGEEGREVLGVANCVGNFCYRPLNEMAGDEVAAAVGRDVQIAANILKCASHRLSAQAKASSGGGAAGAAPGSGGGAAAGNGGGGAAVAGDGGGAATPHAALPFSSSIVYRSSSAAGKGHKHHECFAAAKGAGEAMHLAAAATLCQSGVRVNCVAAGLVEGSPASGEHGAPGSPTAAKSAAMYPPHRLCKAEDVAAAMAVALSPGLLPFTTGATIPCDGGLTRLQAYEAPTAHV